MEDFFVGAADVEPSNFNGYTLIFPAVSVGQVGQLAVDLLLENVNPTPQKIGYIYHDSLLPMIGRDPSRNNTICTSLEVFVSHEQQLVIMQQRAPFVKGRVPRFRSALMKWIRHVGIKQVVVLSSCSAHICQDVHMSGSRVRYLLSDVDSALTERFENEFGWKRFDIMRTRLNDDMQDEKVFHIPGGGIVRSLLDDCSKDNIPCVALMTFTNPGTDLVLAQQLVEHVDSWLKVLSSPASKLKHPLSWLILLRQRGATPFF